MTRPSPRLQRPRSAPLRSPVSRKPLGAAKAITHFGRPPPSDRCSLRNDLRAERETLDSSSANRIGGKRLSQSIRRHLRSDHFQPTCTLGDRSRTFRPTFSFESTSLSSGRPPYPSDTYTPSFCTEFFQPFQSSCVTEHAIARPPDCPSSRPREA